jgi:tRNA 5-methylaminomethyl-2-thiouridine biosynthesis bifunctional protein
VDAGPGDPFPYTPLRPARPVLGAGAPRDAEVGDVYFSDRGAGAGADEVRAVFLDGNDLPRRFATLPPASRFAIGETGFGTGLNFVGAAALFLERAPGDAILDFVSVEHRPWTRADLDRCEPWLAGSAVRLHRELRAHWPPLVPAWHVRDLYGGRVRLHLRLGDVTEAFGELPDACVDAWFLDGFAPDRNPEMWTREVLAEVGRTCRPGGTAATFTVAGPVRRGLDGAGFAVERVPGRPFKRERLRARRRGQDGSDGASSRSSTGAVPPARDPGGAGPSTPVVVVGAGLAGAFVARELAERGRHVLVLDADGPAAGASANRHATLHARPNGARDAAALLTLAGAGFTVARLRSTPAFSAAWRGTGVLQLPKGPREARRLARIAEAHGGTGPWLEGVDAARATRLAGLPVRSGALFYRDGGSADLPMLIAALLDHPRIETRAPLRLDRLEPGAGGWRVCVADHAGIEARHVVLAAGAATPGLAASALPGVLLPLTPLKGEALLGELARPPRLALAGALGVVPIPGDDYVAGTFVRDDPDPAPRPEAREEVLARVEAFEAEHGADLGFEPRSVFAGVRVKVRDHRPLAGPLAPGLWVSTAHGALGLLTAPLLGADLAARIAGGPPALTAALRASVAADRFARDGAQSPGALPGTGAWTGPAAGR